MSQPRRRARLALVVLVAGVVAASAVPASAVAPAKKKPFIGISFGPSAPKFPEQDGLFTKLRAGVCTDDAAKTPPTFDGAEPIFRAAAAICVAAQNPAVPVDWSFVAQAYRDSRSETDCLTRAVRAAVGGALILHRRDPNGQVRFADPPMGPACTPAVTQMLLVNDANGRPHLVVLGWHLFGANSVKVGDRWFGASSDNASQGSQCTRVDVPEITSFGDATAVTLKVKSPDFKTAAGTWPVGPVQPVDVFGSSDYDSTSCLVLMDDSTFVTGSPS